MHQSFEKNMKIPFYTVIGPMLRKYKLTINHVCVHPLLTFAPIYVGVLGVLGVVLSAFDIYRIVKYGSVLPSYMWKGGPSKEKFTTSEAERNCKLVSLVLSVEYYLLLLLGFFTNSSIFYMPFLVLYPLIIFLDIIVFITSMFVDGFNLPKKALIMTMFMIYNWSSAACTFARSMSCCGL
ncbi:uncharacterized protein [Euwallacea fornicatus]|uniref:uncharacterized protein n=1 Tax=Euwallacea fornicatus TaxID=995702 RepID=UPI00338DBD06